MHQPAGQQLHQTQASIPLWRRARRRAYWLLLQGLLFLADRIPITWGRWVGSGLARVGMALRTREMDRARRNLERAFPERGPEQINRLARQSGLALGRNFFDSLAAGRLLAREAVRENCLASGGEKTLAELVRELKAQGRGVLFLTGHVGCWELLGAWAAREFKNAGLGRLGVVTGTLHNPPVDRVVQERRQALGLEVLPRDRGLAPVVRHLRGEGLVAILLDQNTRARNLEVPFMGRPAPTAVGLAQLALKHGIPVVPLGMARVEMDGGTVIHEVRWLDPILCGRRAGEGASQPVSDDELREFLTRCNACLESLIRRNPAEWVWFHERWS